MNKLVEFISRKYVDLIFSLVCGLSYFVIVLKFILSYTNVGGSFLGFLFFPAIVCGMAVVILKTIRLWLEEEKYKQINRMIILHFVLFAISIVFILEMVS